MVKWNKKEIVMIVILLSGAILVPIIIHILYKFDFGIEFLYSTWTSGDILQYCGSVISALLAIIGVYYTLKENRINELSNKVLENKPYFRTNLTQLFHTEEDELLIKNKNRICIWGNNGILSFDLKNSQSLEKFLDYFDDLSIDDYACFYYEIENVGLGNAINFSLNINESHFFPKIVISKDEKIKLYFLIEKNFINKNGKDYVFRLTYEDVIKVNVYEQTERIFISYNEEKDEIIHCRDFEDELSEPSIIEKRIYY